MRTRTDEAVEELSKWLKESEQTFVMFTSLLNLLTKKATISGLVIFHG